MPGTVAAMTVDLDTMLDDLRGLVGVESPSREAASIEASAAAVAALVERRLGSAPEVVDSAAGPHVHWRGEGAASMPAGIVGLRHWTIVLDGVAEVETVRARVHAAGIDARDVPGGFAVTDPFGMTAHVVAAGA